MKKLCGAWKKYKGEVKKFHFKKYRTKKEMLKNRPLEIPKIQFRKLIRYWSLPEIMAKSDKNTENRSKQTCPHRMGNTNFGIVRKQLRESKENHEEPTRAEMFTATRTSKKGKEVDAKTQAVIDEIQHRIEASEDDDDAFISVLGKDQPGRLRCYGGAITKSSLKKDEAQLNPGMTDENVAALVQAQRSSPPDASSRPDNTPNPCSFESTHLPQQE
ncbi:hypothetical protein PIB30_040941 [Stylosanthes scabra]|uniref:Uncharacterized protein n=1 Tax=Stylosanthes scabra TaxID=79078 RepID=A0ABU6ZDG9_9FABA|nr:hypothetical protein [Stylosanthes scabra]